MFIIMVPNGLDLFFCLYYERFCMNLVYVGVRRVKLSLIKEEVLKVCACGYQIVNIIAMDIYTCAQNIQCVSEQFITGK